MKIEGVSQIGRLIWTGRILVEMGEHKAHETANTLTDAARQKMGENVFLSRLLACVKVINRTTHDAFELYLKALLWLDATRDGEDPKKELKEKHRHHCLYRLYVFLPHKIQRRIENEWNKFKGQLSREIALWGSSIPDPREGWQKVLEHSDYTLNTLEEFFEYVDEKLKWRAGNYWGQESLTNPVFYFDTWGPFYEMLRSLDKIVCEELTKELAKSGTDSNMLPPGFWLAERGKD